jgi:hypothetical protein
MSPNDGLIQAALAATRHMPPDEIGRLVEQPTIIVSAPRSGSNLLFELLSEVEDIWTIGRESHVIYNEFPHLRAENARLDSGRLGEVHADPVTRQRFRAVFLFLLRDARGRRLVTLPSAQRPAAVTPLEKTPRNALNMPFLMNVFPKAKFILLHREPRANVASLVEAWKVGLQSGRFVTFFDLPGWDRAAWCFLLPPGWRSMIGKSLVEIAAFQWSASNSIILDNLAKLPAERWTVASYDELVADPAGVRERLCRFVSPDLRCDTAPLAALHLSRTTLSPPHPDKWKKYQQEIAALWPKLDSVNRRLAEASAFRSG